MSESTSTWVNPDLSKTPQELFDERTKRMHDAYTLQVPDRIPITLGLSYLAAEMGGVSHADIYRDTALQRRLTIEALKRFGPDDVSADLNLAFNNVLRTGAALEVKPEHITADQFGKFRNWNELITANGAIDDISFSSAIGLMYVDNGFLRQAVVCFNRVRQLAPENLPVRLQLAQIYLLNKLPDRALRLVGSILYKHVA